MTFDEYIAEDPTRSADVRSVWKDAFNAGREKAFDDISDELILSLCNHKHCPDCEAARRLTYRLGDMR